MPPVAFTFEGVKVYIYPDDHLPVHIRAIYAGYETVYELHFDVGKLVDISIRSNGKEMLPAKQDKKVRKFLKKYFKEVIEKWEQIVIFKKGKVSLKRISDL